MVVRLGTEDTFDTVNATLAARDNPAVATLVKGRAVSLICVGRGSLMGAPLLGGCFLVGWGRVRAARRNRAKPRAGGRAAPRPRFAQGWTPPKNASPTASRPPPARRAARRRWCPSRSRRCARAGGRGTSSAPRGRPGRHRGRDLGDGARRGGVTAGRRRRGVGSSGGVATKSWCETTSCPAVRARTSAATSSMMPASSSTSAQEATASAERNRASRSASPAANRPPWLSLRIVTSTGVPLASRGAHESRGRRRRGADPKRNQSAPPPNRTDGRGERGSRRPRAPRLGRPRRR